MAENGRVVSQRILIALGLLLASSCAKISGPTRTSEKVFKAQWIKDHDPSYSTGNLPIGLSGPLIHQGLVYAGHALGEMRAYDLINGRPIWRKRDNGPYSAEPTPLLEDYITYGSIKGRVYTRHRLNGKLLWNVDLGAAIEGEGVFYNGRLYFHTRNHKIFCLDARTGKILWAYKRSVPFAITLQRVSRPLLYDHKIFVGFADGTIASFSAEEGVLLWESKVFSGSKFIDVDAGPLLFNGKLIAGGLAGDLAVLDKDSGLLERKLGYPVSRAPIVFGQRLILGTSEGEVVVLDRGLKELMRKKVSSNAISAMALWKKGLVVASGGRLLQIDLKNLATMGSFHLGHQSSAVFGRMEVSEGALAVYSSRNRLYLFR